MSKLPSSWTQAPIGSVCVETEQVTPESEAEFTYVDIGSVDRLKKKVMAPQRLRGKDAPSRARKRIRTGDTIVSTTRPNLNAVALVDQSLDGQIASTGFEVLRAPGLDPRWLGYLVRTSAFVDAMTSLVQGALYPAVRGKDVRSFIAPIAPGNEQKRIADKLDTVLTRVDAVNTRLAKVAPILKRFRQSVLAAATSGQLTSDWREKALNSDCGQSVIDADAKAKAEQLIAVPGLAKKKSTTHSQINVNYVFDLPPSWRFTTWGRISEWITYGFTRPMPSSGDGVRLLTAKDIHPFNVRIGTSGFTRIEEFSALSEKDRPVVGDLLITKDGSIGRAAIVRTAEPFCINQSVAVCWLRSTLMKKDYLEIVANADFTQRFVADMAKGMAIQHLSIVDFACCPVPVPPIKEQVEIVRRVKTLFAFADRLEARLQTAQAATDRLTPALLAKAFRGELVPQDPNDEPASELLKRLAAGATAPAPKRGRRKAFDAVA